MPSGAITASQSLAPKSVSPASARVGTSGIRGRRSRVVTASPFTSPAVTRPRTAEAVANTRSTSPVTTASTAGGAPLSGTRVVVRSVRASQSSPAVPTGLPMPPQGKLRVWPRSRSRATSPGMSLAASAGSTTSRSVEKA